MCQLFFSGPNSNIKVVKSSSYTKQDTSHSNPAYVVIPYNTPAIKYAMLS
jgi:hypothetical protein